jgi:hypothetical protein
MPVGEQGEQDAVLTRRGFENLFQLLLRDVPLPWL